MRIQTARRYQLIDFTVPQGLKDLPPLCEVHDIYPYRGQLIIYGSKFAHYNVGKLGFHNVPDHPVCFVVMPDEENENVHAMSRGLKGYRLGLRSMLAIGNESADEIPVMNWHSNMGELWQGPRAAAGATKDELVKRAHIAIDVYWDTRKNGGMIPLNIRRKIAKRVQ